MYPEDLRDDEMSGRKSNTIELQPDGASYLQICDSRTDQITNIFLIRPALLLSLIGGTVASKPLQRQLAAHLCELEPEGRGLARLPGGEAEGRGSRAGSRTSHQTWRGAHTGAGAGECMDEAVEG